MMLRRFLPSLVLLLTGCASAQGGYPSLAKRTIEDAPIAEVTAAPAPAPADAELRQTINRYNQQLTNGKNAFDKAYPTADRATRAASGSAVSSDAWVNAQINISGLEAARNDSVSALANLDTLYVDRENAIAEGQLRGGISEIEAARSAALNVVDSQNDRLDALKARLAQP